MWGAMENQVKIRIFCDASHAFDFNSWIRKLCNVQGKV